MNRNRQSQQNVFQNTQQPKTVSGRIYGQQAAIQQKQQMLQNKQEIEKKQQSRLTVAQAISLITLRLGALETKIMTGGDGTSGSDVISGGDNMTLSDNGEIQSLKSCIDEIYSRIENLEKPVDTSAFKQQIELLKQNVIQCNKMAKTQYETIKNNQDSLRSEVNSLTNVMNEINNKVSTLAMQIEINGEMNSCDEFLENTMSELESEPVSDQIDSSKPQNKIVTIEINDV